MSRRLNKLWPTLIATLSVVAILINLESPAVSQESFVCNGQAFVTQDPRAIEVLPATKKDNYLYEVYQSAGEVTFDFISRLESPPGTPIVVNPVGFRRTDGFLYGWRRGPQPREMVKIDANGDVFSLGCPEGLPEDEAFVAGDVSPDGTEMYFVSVGTITNDVPLRLYRVPLSDAGPGPATWVPISVAPDSEDPTIDDPEDNVADWAANPFDGLLYGADKEGDLAILDPATGERADLAVPGLPAGEKGHGAAWFDSAGRLFLYWNDNGPAAPGQGTLFELNVASRSVGSSVTALSSRRNDGAACIEGGSSFADTTGDNFGYSLATCDFDNNGYEDLAIGVPNEDLDNDTILDAGAVHIIYAADGGFGLQATGSGSNDDDQLWYQGVNGVHGVPGEYEHFGFALAAGNFNGDDWCDLAIGVPGESDAKGQVHILYGTDGGLSALPGVPSPPVQVFSQDNDDLPSENPEPQDNFGWALASGDFDGDGVDELAVGVPGEDSSKGQVHVFAGGASGLVSSGALHLNTGPFAQAGDRFGWSLAAGDFDGDGKSDLAVGSPWDDVSIYVDAGSVSIIFADPAQGNGGIVLYDRRRIQGWNQSYEQFGFALASGDFNDDGVDDLAFGAPYYDEDPTDPQNSGCGVGSNCYLDENGSVNILFGSNDPDEIAVENWWDFQMKLSDDGGGIGTQEFFGYSLVFGDFDGDGADDLAIGVPGKEVTEAGSLYPKAGRVRIVYGEHFEIPPFCEGCPSLFDVLDPDGLEKDWFDRGSVTGGAVENAGFGFALASGELIGNDYSDLAIGIPGDLVGASEGAGTVNVLFGSGAGLGDFNQVLCQGCDGMQEAPE